MNQKSSLRRLPKGFTLIETAVVLTVLSTAMVAMFDVMHIMTSESKSEIAHSTIITRTNGTIYDIVAELRQATAYSPNFTSNSRPVSAAHHFDLVAGVDAYGTIIWGDMVTYRLVLAPKAQLNTGKDLGIVAGQLVRDQVTAGKGGGTVTTVIEDNVPYQFVKNGVTSWGFMVGIDRNALSLGLSRFADTGVETKDVYMDAISGSNASSTIAIATSSGVYFLRNPQEILDLQ